jgi:hypothetical protein
VTTPATGPDRGPEPVLEIVVRLPRAAPAPDLTISTLGAARITSPIAHLLDARQTTEHDADEDDRVLLDDTLAGISSRGVPPSELPAATPLLWREAHDIRNARRRPR